ncbi:MAG: glutamine-hydrolyzing GMP synthase [Defluviitaleaceae bacterium]|nr:glutamine-hydrolyzing GMP synthase [Defluviitaleaceae bacterium]
MKERIVVLDFGGQYKELIARAVRSQGVYSEIMPGDISAARLAEMSPKGIILTGGPASVNSPESPKCDPEIFGLGVPVLGICYGMQLMCHTLGGKVSKGDKGEYGVVDACFKVDSKLFAGMSDKGQVLMSHNDQVAESPAGFNTTATTSDCPIAACEDSARGLYAVQFHPESAHTIGGEGIIKNFLYNICGASGDYRLDDYIDRQIEHIRQKVGGERVLLALSGGVDSSVCAALLSKAIPNQLTCIFVDHGFMRQNEGDDIEAIFSKQNLNFVRVNAGQRFLDKLQGVTDPEAKRKIIGEEFVRVFEEEGAKLGGIKILAQGTIYPDIVESGVGAAALIKSHHNVGGLPENLDFTTILEPLSELFKDEVRNLGEKLGLPSRLTNRQPFPGPGLAIRIMGEVTQCKLELLRCADAILREELDNITPPPDQYFAVLTDTRTVGVKGDDRTYDPVIALRAVTTDDFMTCNFADISLKTLGIISSRITSEVAGVSRVVYDITSKPPATVEWE